MSEEMRPEDWARLAVRMYSRPDKFLNDQIARFFLSNIWRRALQYSYFVEEYCAEIERSFQDGLPEITYQIGSRQAMIDALRGIRDEMPPDQDFLFAMVDVEVIRAASLGHASIDTESLE